MNVGANGRCSDAQLWNSCSLKTLIINNKAKLPDPAPLPNSNQVIPFHILGDDAFALSTYLMKPHPGQLVGSHEDQVKMRTFDYR